MLTSLRVKNIALAKEVDLEFGPGLNVLSGETGAGKSVLLNSILFGLGFKNDRGLIRNGADSALVELVFRAEDEETVRRLEAMDVFPEDGEYRFSRRLTPVKSIARLNGEQVPLSLMKAAAEELIDIYTQNEKQELLHEGNYLAILDRFGGKEIASFRARYEAAYKTYKLQKEEIRKLGSDDEERKRTLDFLAYELREIEDARLKPGEDEELKARYALLSKAQVLKEGLSGAAHALSESDGLSAAMKALQDLVKFDESLAEPLELLKNAESILGDALEDVKRRLFAYEDADAELPAVETRIDEIARLKAKYGNSVDEILKTYEKIGSEHAELERLDREKDRLLEEMERAKERLLEEARRLTGVREKAALEFSRKMGETLKQLNFLDVRFEAVVNQSNRFTSEGQNTVTLLASFNPGEPMKPLYAVASGGELSRVMLAVKTLSDAEAEGQKKTLIFDEIDTGISGKTARLVGERLAEVSTREQVILISHLPQIVALSDCHYKIEKEADGQETITKARRLSADEKELEVARLISAGDPTEQTILAARELIGSRHK